MKTPCNANRDSANPSKVPAMPECSQFNARGLLAVLRRDTSEELPVKGCRNDVWDGILDLDEPKRAKAAAATDTTKSQEPHGLEEDYGVTI